jgi:tRNA U34 5-carboxymethylaminomethyl modifying GTPase MnmE/TrmE
MGVQICCKKECYSENNKNDIQVEPDESLNNNYNSMSKFDKKELNLTQNSNINPTIDTTGIDLSNNSLNKAINQENCEKKPECKKEKVSNIKNKIKNKTNRRRSAYLNRTFINIMIIGDKNTGKTSFLKLLKNNKFSDKYEATKEDEESYDKKIVINQNNINMNILVCNNINKKEVLNSNKDYYLLFYDITNLNSLEFIKKLYLENFIKKLQIIDNKLSNIILVGNKIDLKQDDSIYNQMENFCKENNLNHFEISTKNNKGINEISNLLVENFNNLSTSLNK